MNNGPTSPVFPSRKEKGTSSLSANRRNPRRNASGLKGHTLFMKKRKIDFDEIEESNEKAMNKGNFSEDNNYESFLDDTFMTCDIDAIINTKDEGVTKENIKDSTDVSNDLCKITGNSSSSEKPKTSDNDIENKIVSRSNGVKRVADTKTYVSPGKFQLKVRNTANTRLSNDRNRKRFKLGSPRVRNSLTSLNAKALSPRNILNRDLKCSKLTNYNKCISPIVSKKENHDIDDIRQPNHKESDSKLNMPNSKKFQNESDKGIITNMQEHRNSLNTKMDETKSGLALDNETLLAFNETFNLSISENIPVHCPSSPDLFSENASTESTGAKSQDLDDFTPSQETELLFLMEKVTDTKKDDRDKATGTKASTEKLPVPATGEIKYSDNSKSKNISLHNNLGRSENKNFSPPAMVSAFKTPSPSSHFCSTLRPRINKTKSHETTNLSSDISQTSIVESDTLDSQNLMLHMISTVSSTQKTDANNTQQVVLNTSDVRQTAAVEAVLEKVQQAQTEGSVGFELGPFFGLPSTVKELFSLHRGIDKLYDWQIECINKGVPGKNLLISLPTSGGKTLVAEILMLRTLLVHKKHAILVLPYVALVQEKVRGLSPLAVELGFLLEEYAGSRGSFPPKKRIKKSVAFVATIEKAAGLINSFLEERRSDEVGLVVIDEAHMLGEGGGRGALLESLITKINYATQRTQIVSMSATISNLQQLAQFMRAELYTGQFRPVKLKQYVKFLDQVAEINPSALTDEELLSNYRPLQHEKVLTREERNRDPDGLTALVREVVPSHSVLVFCSSRHNCESVARLLATLLSSELKRHKTEEKHALYKALTKEGDGAVCPVLTRVLPYGIAYHHSGLTEGERKLIEEGYLTGTLCVITCTSTLAAGINLPARRVILRSPYTGREPLTRSRYTQMVGRAGRAGMDSCGESFLIMQPKDIAMVPSLVRGPVEKCVSQLCETDGSNSNPRFAHATAIKPSLDTSNLPSSSITKLGVQQELLSYSGLRDLIFSSVGLGLVQTPSQIMQLISCSLLALQAPQLGFKVEEVVYTVLQKLRECAMLRIRDPAADGQESHERTTPTDTLSWPDDDLSDAITRVSVALRPDHLLSISRLGKAAVKGCVELSMSKRLYDDLIVARSSLAVHSRLHLLYLVTPYTAAQEIKMQHRAFYDAYCLLNHEELKVAELIGITEAVAVRVYRNNIKDSEIDTVKRFHAAIIIHRLIAGESIWKVSEKFEVPRGLLQRTMTAAAAFASCVHHFCQELEELWAFKDLLASFSRQLQGCCSAQLLPLMDLPGVKLGRARLLYAAGFTNLTAIANADPKQLVQSLHHLPHSAAREMVLSAKALLLERAEALQEEAEQMLMGFAISDTQSMAGGNPTRTTVVTSGSKQTTVDGKQTSVDGKQTLVDGKQTSVDGKQTSVDGKQTSVDGKQTSVDGKQTSVDGKQTSVDGT